MQIQQDHYQYKHQIIYQELHVDKNQTSNITLENSKILEAFQPSCRALDIVSIII